MKQSIANVIENLLSHDLSKKDAVEIIHIMCQRETLFLGDFRERRRALGMSLVDVEKGCGVSRSTISRVENGAECELRTVKKLDVFYKQNGV